jgi:hypothetical protein
LFHRLVIWIVGLGALLVGACGPILYVSQVTLKAERAVAAAKHGDGDRWAPYEYFGAEAFLDQAKYRAAFGDFMEAYRYGKKAQQMAEEASSLTRRRKEEDSDQARPPVPREESPREGAPPERER